MALVEHIKYRGSSLGIQTKIRIDRELVAFKYIYAS